MENSADVRDEQAPAQSAGASEAHAMDHRQGSAGRAAQRFGRRDLLIVLGVFALALTVRVVYVLQLRSSPLFDHHIMDAAYHDEWAQARAAGRTFVDGPYFRAPLYPWLLGAVYRLCGTDPLWPRLVQVVIGSASCVLVYLIGRATFGRLTGALAAMAAATYWVFCYFEAELLIVGLAMFLDLLLLGLVLWAGQRPSPLRWLLAGLALGLSAIARPSILVFAPVVLLWIILRQRRRAAWPAVGFCCGALIAILPITVRNYVAGGDFVLISSQGGVNFFIGNNPYSDGVTAVVPGTPPDWWGGYFGAIRLAERVSGRPLKPSEVSRFYFGQGLRFWGEWPGGASSLFLRKLSLFWTPRELGNNKDPHFFTARYTPIVRWLPLSFVVIAPLGLAGMILRRRDWLALLPLWGFVFVYMLGVVAFFVNSRFRVPIVPVLMLFGASAVVWAVRSLRRREYSTVGGAALLTVCLGVLLVAATGPQGRSDAHSYQTLAVTYYDNGQYDQAIEWCRKWIGALPQTPDGHIVLAKSLAGAGRPEEGLAALQAYLRSNPANAQVVKTLTSLLARLGHHAETIDFLRSALAAQPHDMGLANLLAWYLVTAPDAGLRDGPEALELVSRANEASQGGIADVLDALAATYAELGRFDEACEVAIRAIELAKSNRQFELAEEIAARLRLYRARQPYRE